MCLYQFRSKGVDAAPVVVVAFQSVAVCETRSFLESNSTTSLSAHTVLVFYSHDFLREITLVHIEIETVHGDQLRKSDVVGLALVIRESVSKDEYTLL